MEHLGRYRLRHRLGAGAFATVWLAHDDELDIEVALKVLADNWAANADVRERFLAEARLLRRIADDRVVRVHDIGVVNDQPFFVMDYIGGGTVEDAIRQGVTQVEALRIGADTAYAVQVLHEHGYVHRDVKPGNLLLQWDSQSLGRVVVTDLGTAKALAEASGLTVTAGTPAYMAPEQVQGEGGFDERADVYAIAAVTYALLTGSPPYAVSTLAQVATRSGRSAPAKVAATLGLPPRLDTLLADALSAKPSDRPASARELGDMLMMLAGQAKAGTVLRPAWSRRLVAVLAVMAFVVSGAGTWLVLSALR
jgi:serine/threonine protein kinase